MVIYVSSKFERSYKKLPHTIKDRTEKREKMFLANPFDGRLHTHKLHGKEKNHFAYAIDSNYRIKFLFLEDGNVLYLDVGTHDEVY
jgi:mRNA-degrading endonuclease RelE of RelBE toxin-antitoxin system